MQNTNPARTPAADALSWLMVQIFQLNGALTAAGDALAKPAGQSTARWQVLACVERAPMPVAQIARTLGLARQSVQRVADLLADEQLCRYADNPQHQRAKLLVLEAAGSSALAAIQAAQRSWANALGEQLAATGTDAEHIKAASAVLGQLLALLKQEGKDDD
ncbi:DNA-binding transcriptional regulator, MarR family [Andreprevotia lacus DSM 23236]|jgi:DNA-binding MarR family transcriptional regulator|uniref:DNA-binding transcriptional regulator, MarR family n=1 Tax=Andreprevotia lacus DSM 23236 TaxID=1121001 RepID=A0A1W1X6L2_9NEIS|nr:MarR family winged helix-turn-helix transcriptional regulator [Andreprevotia lacus]SMC19576.1 DNA-binding transcriptional regulator, MarR family [Andreprevotia lacus DSM 23236]